MANSKQENFEDELESQQQLAFSEEIYENEEEEELEAIPNVVKTIDENKSAIQSTEATAAGAMKQEKKTKASNGGATQNRKIDENNVGQDKSIILGVSGSATRESLGKESVIK